MTKVANEQPIMNRNTVQLVFRFLNVTINKLWYCFSSLNRYRPAVLIILISSTSTVNKYLKDLDLKTMLKLGNGNGNVHKTKDQLY